MMIQNHMNLSSVSAIHHLGFLKLTILMHLRIFLNFHAKYRGDLSYCSHFSYVMYRDSVDNPF